jgi:DNA-binding HxlR family transcriptional regulator
LSLLSVPLNAHVLAVLEEEPKSLIELRRAVGSPPQTTFRNHLRALTQIGVLERRRQPEFPGTVDYELTAAGRDLISVALALRVWLADAPDGPMQPGSVAAKSAIKALIDGWSSRIIRAVAAKPLSLTELSKVVPSLNYPSLERRLGAMRTAGQVAYAPRGGRSRPYVATAWLQHAMAPLAAAASWERRHVRHGVEPLASADIEAMFLLVVPTLRLPSDLTGGCRLAVELKGSGAREIAGVHAFVSEGTIQACAPGLRGASTAWAAGSASGWFEALLDGQRDRLELGGDTNLAVTLVDELHATLGTRVVASSVPVADL